MSRKVAFTAVVVPDKGYGIAIVEDDIAGFALDPQEKTHDNWNDAQQRALEKNVGLGLDAQQVWNIVSSSMAASDRAKTRWGQRGA